MADFARKGKQEKKALPLFPLSDRCDDNPGALEKIFTGVGHAVAGQLPASRNMRYRSRNAFAIWSRNGLTR